MTRRTPTSRATTGRTALAALALTLSAALAGCVSIPTSGAVVAGPPIDDSQSSDFIPLTSGPIPGSSQEDILQDFITAATSPANDYAIAKLFLTDTAKQEWNPDTVVVRTGPATVSRVGEAVLQYTAKAAATVDETGRYSEYPEPVSQVRQFSFTQVDGEWRINAAPDGIVLSQNSFGSVFDEHALYFFDPTYHYLVPDVRWFPSRATIPDRIVRALLAGPSEWLRSGVVLSEFPAATKLAGSVDILAGTATVELSAEASSAGPEQRNRMRQQLAASLGALTSGVSNVVMTVGGVPLIVPDTGTAIAVVNPGVETAPLIEFAEAGSAPEFGFPSADGAITPISGISEQVVALGAVGVTLAADQRLAGVLNGAGVSLVMTSSNSPVLLDSRAGLVVPSVDTLGYVWSVPRSSAAGLVAFDKDAGAHPITSTLPADARIVSIDVSRDGARALLYLQSDVGPRLVVAGILRSDGEPVALGALYELPVPAGAAIDAAWVDDRTVAALYSDGSSTFVTAFPLGGPSVKLSDADGATAIVGGNGGTDGIRLLADGRILRPQGSGGWQSTGIEASLLGTQQ